MGGLDLSALESGQHVAGAVDLTLRLDSLAGRIDRVEVFVDDQAIASFGGAQSTVRFVLDTYAFSEGEHLVSAAIYVRNPTAGLLNVVGAPAAVLAVPLVFDQTPPTPVRGLTAALDGSRPTVQWEPNSDPNFHAYVIYRRAFPSTSYESGDGVEVARITDRSTTSFTDRPLAEVYGGGASYVVAVSNRAVERSEVWPVTATFGTERTVSAPSGRTAISPDGEEIYAVVGPDMVAFSAATGGVLRRLRLPGSEGTYNPRCDLHLDAETGRLYVAIELYGEWPLVVVEPETFDTIAQYKLPFGAERFAVHDGRLFAMGGPQGTFLNVIDAETGALLGRSGTALEPFAQIAALAVDGSAVYAIERRNGVQNALVRLDVSTDQPVVTRRRALGYGSDWTAAATTTGRVVVHEAGTPVTAYDGVTLAAAASFTPAGSDNYRPPQAIREVDGSLYVALGGRTDPAQSGSEVVALDLASLAPVRTFALAGPLTSLAPGPDGLLAIGGLGSWVLPY